MNQKGLVNFLIVWITNAIILLLAGLVFPKNIVLGNDKISTSMAAVIAGFLLALLAYLVPKAVEKLEFKVRNDYAWNAIYFGSYAVFLWIIKKFAQISGLGISSNLYVLVVALVITVVGWRLTRVVRSVWKMKLFQ